MNNFLNKESQFTKKRKLEKGKEVESYTDLTDKIHVHKSASSLLPRKRISDSEFNFNITTADVLNSTAMTNWELPSNHNEELMYNENVGEIDHSKIIVNEPSDIPIIEEVDDNYPFLNSHTLQYEFIPEGINEGSTSNALNNNENYNYASSSLPPPVQPSSTKNANNNNDYEHEHESSLIPFKNGSQVILYNNNYTGQVVLYNKTNKSLSIHKVRPMSKEIMSRNKRCILCNQLLPSERENVNTNNMFKNSQTFTDSKYFRLLACSLSYNKKPSLTDVSNESNISPIHSVNSAENIVNLLNDHSNSNSEYMSAHPTISITNNSNASSNDQKNENEENDDKSSTTTNPKNNESFSNNNNNSSTYLSSSSFNNGYYERFFIERKKLGRGFRGSVFLCHHVLDQVFLGEYAIKKVAVGNNHQWLVRMLKEVMLLEKLRNPNIIEYKHAWLEEHKFSSFGPKVPCLFILMERANGGNLEEYVQLQWNPEEQLEKVLSTKEKIKRRRLQMKNAQNQIRDNRAQFFGGIGYDSFGKRVRYLTTEAIWKIFLDICYGLNHLHELGIIHRDLKPPNLLLQYKDPNNQEEIPKVLISDFGECEILSNIEKRQRTGATGTLEFMAPELLMSDESGHYYDDYSSNSDLWSLGVVLYYICFSEMPYSQVDDIDILKNEILSLTNVQFKNDNNSNRVPKELKSLIKKLMVKVPTARPKAREILDLYGGYKDGTSIKISTNEETLSKTSPNPSSASISVSSSIKNVNELSSSSTIPKASDNSLLSDTEKNSNSVKNNITNNNFLSPYQNTDISKNKAISGGKERNKDTSLLNTHNHSENPSNRMNENHEAEPFQTINPTHIKDKEKVDEKEEGQRNTNDPPTEKNENDIEWLDKEMVDEPLSFQVEKRIIPFNHNRSKSLPYLPNNNSMKGNGSPANPKKPNPTIHLIEEEEPAEDQNDPQGQGEAKRASPTRFNNTLAFQRERKEREEGEEYKLEKRLVPFFDYEHQLKLNRSYPPLKNNETEPRTGSRPNKIMKKRNISPQEEWQDQKEYAEKLLRKKSNEILAHSKEKMNFIDLLKPLGIDHVSVSNLQNLWTILKQKPSMEAIYSFIKNKVSVTQTSPRPTKTKGLSKRKGGHSYSKTPLRPKSTTQPRPRPRPSYQKSKIYFIPRSVQSKRKNHTASQLPIRKEKSLTEVHSLMPYHPTSNNNYKWKSLSIANQTFIPLNILLFLLKAYVFYQILYPHILFFSIIITLILYKSSLLRYHLSL